MTIRTILLTCLCLALSACNHEKLVEGGLYSTHNNLGDYSVIKILKLDANGVHLRLYSNPFIEHPSSLDESALYIRGLDLKPHEKTGIGHMPVSNQSFATWKVRFIKITSVKDDELEGYKMWLEAKGGYF